VKSNSLKPRENETVGTKIHIYSLIVKAAVVPSTRLTKLDPLARHSFRIQVGRKIARGVSGPEGLSDTDIVMVRNWQSVRGRHNGKYYIQDSSFFSLTVLHAISPKGSMSSRCCINDNKGNNLHRL
jgi:hypothetical protein